VLVAAGVAFLVWLAASRGAMRKSLVESSTLFSVATTGLATMSLELVLLVIFQSLYGYVYVRVGIIVAVFMLGLAVGSLVMKRLIRRRGEVGLGSLIVIDAGLAVFSGALPGVLWLLGRASAQGYPPWVVEWTVWTCVLVGGILGGAIFPLSANIILGEGRQTGGAAGSVDAADNVGACLGALLTGVVLVPAIGIASTCLVLALLKVLSALFLAAARMRGPHPSPRRT
jgi:spermidine synthase